jgi:hypothetical protein
MRVYIVQDRTGDEHMPFTTVSAALACAVQRSYERNEPMYICEAFGSRSIVHRIVDVRPLHVSDAAPLHCEVPNGK